MTIRKPRDSRVADGILAGAIAGIVSGGPSTLASLRRGDSLLTSTRAAGTLFGRPSVVRGLVAHTALSLGWGIVLSRVLPRGHRCSTGLAAGAGIALLDLGIVGRRFPAIRALLQLPQWADHLAFGAVAGAVLTRRDQWHPDASRTR